jgi:flagellar biosynthesis GTPase FlhF
MNATIPAEVQSNQLALMAPKQAQSVLEIAQSFTIDSTEMFSAAGDELRQISTKRKAIEEARLTITRPMDAAKKAVMDFFAQPLELLGQAESLLRGEMLTYKQAEDAKAAAAKAEAERIQREERAKAEVERRTAEEAQRKATEEARTAQAAGDKAAQQRAAEAQRVAQEAQETAQAQIELAEIAPPLPVAVAPKAAGISFRGTWKAEVTDIVQLVTAVASRPELTAIVQVDHAALNQLARATKGSMTIPGVRFYEEQNLAARRSAA